MAGHDLIDSYLAELARRLPADVVDELSDGLEETFRNHARRGLGAVDAALAATTEFGDPDQIAAAFTRQSAGRRTALALLATGPVFAAAWGGSLIASRAWTWAIPISVAVALGAALLGVVAALVTVATSRSYPRTRLAIPACGALIVLDTAVLVVVAVAAPVLSWPMTLAIPASLIRIGITAHRLPRIVTSVR